MRYSDTDLTEATKDISYLKSIRIYAAVILFLSLLYTGFKIYRHTPGTELYLLYSFTGAIIFGSLSALIHLNNITANIYGISYIIAGLIYLFSIIYYRSETEGSLMAIGLILGLVIVRQGISVAFGNRSKEVFSVANQKKVAFIRNLVKSLKQTRTDEGVAIHCTYIHEGGKRHLHIRLFDDVACFLLNESTTPVFFNRKDMYISELENNLDFVKVSIVVDNHDWLEAYVTPNDFQKYELWKEH